MPSESGTRYRRRLLGLDKKPGGRCVICKRKVDTLRADHDHTTGATRGALCHHCNTGLGMFQDDPVLLMKAATYLKEWAWAISNEAPTWRRPGDEQPWWNWEEHKHKEKIRRQYGPTTERHAAE